MTQSVLSEWHGTADAPLPTDIKSAPVPAGEELLHYEYNVVTLPAAEAALLTRIAEVAVEYSISHNYDKRKELFRLAKEWRKWSRDNR